MTFTRAYCTAPACNPSRASLRSGQRPSTPGCYLNSQNWRPGISGDHAKIVASGRWKEAVQAYLATIAFCDSQVGRLFDGLEKSPQRDNTIVCLWSDHGWSLGEKSHWRKFALWEEPTRTVFVWKVPGMTQSRGVCGRTVDTSASIRRSAN